MNTWISSFIVSHETEGFGLNGDLLETNIINIGILIALLVYVLGNFLKENLSERQTYIVNAIQDCEKRLNEATARLQEAESQWVQTQIGLTQLRGQIKQNTASLGKSVTKQAQEKIAQISANSLMSLKQLYEEGFLNIRNQLSELALNRVAARMYSQLNNKDDQALMIDNAINRLGEVSYDQ